MSYPMISSVITLRCVQYSENKWKMYVLEAYLLICHCLYHSDRDNIDESCSRALCE